MILNYQFRISAHRLDQRHSILHWTVSSLLNCETFHEFFDICVASPNHSFTMRCVGLCYFPAFDKQNFWRIQHGGRTRPFFIPNFFFSIYFMFYSRVQSKLPFNIDASRKFCRANWINEQIVSLQELWHCIQKLLDAHGCVCACGISWFLACRCNSKTF